MPNQHSTAAPPWFAGPAPKVLTYVYPDPEPLEPEFQLQWDYQIEWQSAGEPKIKLLRFRSYQRTNVGDKRVLVEEITQDIPINEQIAMNIATHAAGYLFANANLSGEWRGPITPSRLCRSLEEALQFGLTAPVDAGRSEPPADLMRISRSFENPSLESVESIGFMSAGAHLAPRVRG